MNYKQYIINMILQFDTNHTKEYLYTLYIRELVYIKDRLLEKVDGYLKVNNINVTKLIIT